MRLTHVATRKALGTTIDGILKYVNKDKEKNLLKLVDISEQFLDGTFSKEAFDKARNLIKNPDGKWMKYLDRALNELDPHVIKMTALNLGFEAGFSGYKKT